MGGDSAALAMLCPINVVLEDCYITLVNANDIIVGSHTSRLVYTVTVKYEGKTVLKIANTNGGTDEKQSGCDGDVSGSVGAIVAAAGGAMQKCRRRKTKLTK